MRRAALVVLMIVGCATAASPASAQTIPKQSKVGPVTCDVNYVTREPFYGDYIYYRTTGCSIAYKNKSAFCGTKRRTYGPYHDKDRYCELKFGANDVNCGDHFLDGWIYGSDQFTGCKVVAGGSEVDCGRTIHVVGHYGYGHDDSVGCQVVGGPGASCGQYESYNGFGGPPYYYHGYRCNIGPNSLDCYYDGGYTVDTNHPPEKCRLTIPAVMTCDIVLADPAGSLTACLTGTSARRLR